MNRLVIALSCGTLVSAVAAQGPALMDEALQADAERLIAHLSVMSLRPDGDPARTAITRLLKDLHVKFKTFETATPGELALGLDYDLQKTLTRPSTSSSFSLDLAATGNVAFDKTLNPDDFLSTAVRVRWFGSVSLGAGADREATTASVKSAKSSDLLNFDPTAFGAFAAKAARYNTPAEVRADPSWNDMTQRFFEGYIYKLPPELIWDIALDGALESNQDFSSRQPTLGLSIGGRLVSWNPASALSALNLFDYPAAAVRWLTETDQDFMPSGEAWPTIVVGLDYVDGSEDDVRQAVTDDNTYLRFKLEAGVKSRLARSGDESAFLSVGVRYYREINPPDAIDVSGLDQYSHVQVGIELTSGWALTYSAGRLPLDAKDDSLFALGFTAKF